MIEKPEIIMNAVESSNIAKIGYDQDVQILVVEFKNGAAWRYKNVPVEIYTEFQKAPSKGLFLSKHIKNVFEGQKIEPKKEENIP